MTMGFSPREAKSLGAVPGGGLTEDRGSLSVSKPSECKGIDSKSLDNHGMERDASEGRAPKTAREGVQALRSQQTGERHGC
jgi:hypothetical protein